jgi:magnesium chelatase subunit D
VIDFASALSDLPPELAAAPTSVAGPDDDDAETGWRDAVLSAALLAVDGDGLKGIVLRALPGPVRDRWMAVLAAILPDGTPLRRVPLHITDDRLLGGLDLAATLRNGRPVADAGILVEADGGLLVLAMAERAEPSTLARITATLDTGEVAVERDGFAARRPTRIGVVALDEGVDWDERPPPGLRERLSIHLDLSEVSVREAVVDAVAFDAAMIEAARARLPSVEIDEQAIEALCGTALALGVGSLRASGLAVRVARAHAALAGRERVETEDAAAAARLVLACRATRVPAAEPDEPQPDAEPEPPKPQDEQRENQQDDTPPQDLEKPLEDQVQEAAEAAIPLGLLAMLQAEARRRGAGSSGRSGASHMVQRGGRPVGSRRGELKSGARVAVLDTLRVAAPWQPIRRAERSEEPDSTALRGPKVLVRPDDIRLTRFKKRRGTVTIFAVDASGSAALNRLAEAKGAVELLLADCYVRRDEVALIAFRGGRAELMLPPTRSLTRAKRLLSILPGGGGTPLASGIDAAAALAERVVKQGRSVSIVILTDGRPNVNRAGIGGRAEAEADALHAAQAIARSSFPALVVDMAPRPQPFARTLSDSMAALYMPLPRADSRTLSRAVQAATKG